MNTDDWFMCYPDLPPILSKEETYKLIKLAADGSEDAKKKLITHNIRLILYEISRKFYNVAYDKKDLASIGNIGLINAVNNYDLSKGYEFSTYAARCIDNEIIMFLRKLKKDQNTDSIDRIVIHGKDGNALKIEDKLADDNDSFEKYEQNETYKIIRQLLEQLPEREKEIVKLNFGFYNDKIYTQAEIAAKFNISQSYASRLINKIVKKLGEQLEEMGVIELHPKAKEKEKNNKYMRKLQSIYEYFKDYTKEQIDEMLLKLSDEERNLIMLRYGDDLNNPIQSKLSKEATNKFYGQLVPKMKRLLKNPNGEKGQKRTKKDNVNSVTQETNSSIKKDSFKGSHSILSADESQIAEESYEERKIEERISIPATGEMIIKNEELNNDITKSDCLKMLELLRKPTFTQMMSILTVKEAIILSLKLGYVDGKYFSTESIAQFLGIEEAEVIEATKKVLLLYKENINSFLDNIIEATTEQVGNARVLSKEQINK